MEFLSKVWSRLETEEKMLFARERKRKIRETVTGIIFLVVVCLESYIAHFSYAAVYNPNTTATKLIPIPALWSSLDSLMSSDSENIIVISMLGAAALAIVGSIIAFSVRIITNKLDGNAPTIAPKTKSIDSALNWAQALDKRWEKKSRIYLFSLLISVFWIAAVTAISTLLCKSGTADSEAVLNNIFIGCQEAACFAVTWAVLKINVYTSVPDGTASHAIIEDIKKHKKKQKEEAEKQRRAEEKQKKINEGIQLFLDGKYAEAKKHLKSLSDTNSGDVAAIKILSTKKLGEKIDTLRSSYNNLWKAKDLGFINDDIRKAVDLALKTITPVIMKEAQKDIFEIYQNFLDGYTGSMTYNCEKHVAYGHPEAIVMQIVGYVQSEHMNNPRRYEGWLESLKMAERRGLSEITKDIAEELIVDLEIKIRYNKEYEEEEKRRQRRNPFTPSFYMPGPLSSWAEPSGWTDFRTGETLYRVEGKIVNANGEEVSPAWWE